MRMCIVSGLTTDVLTLRSSACGMVRVSTSHWSIGSAGSGFPGSVGLSSFGSSGSGDTVKVLPFFSAGALLSPTVGPGRAADSLSLPGSAPGTAGTLNTFSNEKSPDEPVLQNGFGPRRGCTIEKKEEEKEANN
uniref:Uncharacterized protein n=1 Tax=Anopheles coluzzii TaxID=1518534 RepID=A0A8W7P1F1_ANOCL